jgi:cysteine desulfurase
MTKSMTYFDHAATTPVAPEVLQVMLPWFSESFGNPSSNHGLGVEAQAKLDECRRTLGQPMGCKPSGVVFTAGGTEADVIALRGALARSQRSRHIVVPNSEHKAVLETARSLERAGHRLTLVPVGPDGVVDVETFVDAVEPETAVASLMAVNNELGTIQPVAEVARRVKEKAPKALFHVDAVQAFGRLPAGFTQWPDVDTIAVSAHKLYGPKGAGALFLKDGVHLEPILTGGGQEGGVRSGTHNVAGAVGLAEAFRLTYQRRAMDRALYEDLNNRLLELLDQRLPDTGINGPREGNRVPYNINLRFPGVPPDPLLNGLEGDGFLVSTGSACHSKSGALSHVLSAIGVGDGNGASLRVSFGRSNTVEDIDRFIDTLCELVPRLKTVAKSA